MKIIHTEKASEPAGYYSQAMEYNGMVFVSGQLPVKPSGDRVLGSIEDQASQALENLKSVLEEAGSGLDKVLKTTVYVSDIALWDKVNEVYGRYFGDHRPARVVVPTRELHYGFKVEIEAVAVVK